MYLCVVGLFRWKRIYPPFSLPLNGGVAQPLHHHSIYLNYLQSIKEDNGEGEG